MGSSELRSPKQLKNTPTDAFICRQGSTNLNNLKYYFIRLRLAKI